ncbi:protein kinase [Drepanopeziza brunnea f. sp. 'multigermtubi' MB_m1]|uniref:EKC/KEOPS complex subunit BUD32 n=1 Tax=Marssonina brunnea f. sp. multigermtubi (strain MB_m1) TaxID=1072389 RepID=K1WC02_MARBU|nr:protein kinase [Drepanopeziza brunnea f. sp. 'multigermtubi' MB_m1]EKD14915.1 protein kinase [Drepanopeziza brunnea f. sp. 'multigermtubi' MB_m1]
MNFLIQDNEPATTVKPGIPIVVVSSIAEKQEHDTNAGEGKEIFQRADDLKETIQPMRDKGNEKLRDDGNLYSISKFEKVKDVEYYTKDGFHPMSIGDNFKDGKYRIVHKLRNEAFATVWLARDIEEERYVAIKIALADFSKKFSDNQYYMDAESRQRMALQLAQTLAILHSAEVEIVHRDLTSANVLLELKSIDSYSQVLYETADLTRLLGHRTSNIRVIDFGESFFVDKSLEESVGTPADFRSPELLLENKCGKGSNI